jgi:two-component system, OmpR family, phosphate regulon sensor histidine kinase PhoR
MATALMDELRKFGRQIRLQPMLSGAVVAIAAFIVIAHLVAGLPAAIAGAIGAAAGVALVKLSAGGLLDGSVDETRHLPGTRRDVAGRPFPAGAPWARTIDAMPDPVIAVDRDHIVLHANRAALDLFPSMRIGAAIALANRSPELAEAINAVIVEQSPRSVSLHERMPVERRLDATVSPLARDSGNLPDIVIVMRDVSERERLAQMRADFIAHASHELRTPLAALRGFIETLQGAAKNDVAARERFLGIMSSEAQRMSRILDDLLSLARLEMRAHIAPTGHVDVNEVLSEVVESLEPIAAAVETTIQVDAPGEPCLVRGDRDEIVQVFVNILQNAIKYGRQGGAVTLQVSFVDGQRRRLRIAISDDGPGISEEHLPRLTERFYRVDDKSSREKGGTGLGLAIVKHIIARHRGELKIASKLGLGSTFTVELPVDD